jgi:hypothetical protein
LFDPSTWVLFEAMGALGPISGWRCVHPTYTYDPRRERADSTLMSQAPEEALALVVPALEIDKVEANLRSGDTTIWTRVVSDDGTDAERRVYVLSPGRLQSITFDLAPVATTICSSHMGDWRIIAEHRLS